MMESYELLPDHTTQRVTRADFTWPDSETRRVAVDILEDGKVVSTVFLVLDHSSDRGPPMLFETMVFPSETDFEEFYMRRYSTWDEAAAGHAEIVEALKNGTLET